MQQVDYVNGNPENGTHHGRTVGEVGAHVVDKEGKRNAGVAEGT